VCVCEEEEEEEEEEEREAKENGSLKIFYNYEFDIPFSAHYPARRRVFDNLACIYLFTYVLSKDHRPNKVSVI
jgi:hypothetical protein